MKRIKSLSFTSTNPPLRTRNNSTDGSVNKIEKYEKSEQGGSAYCNFRYGAVAIQGFRPHMQDDFSCSPSENIKGDHFGFFAVFDGHGQYGDMVSKYCADNFMNSLVQRKILRTAKSLSSDVLIPALRKTFVKFDSQLKEAVLGQKPPQHGENLLDFLFSGTTATSALVLNDSIIVANVGDSRTILCRNGGVYFASKDHNPGDKVEDDRITAAGGRIHTTPSKHKVILDPEAYTNLAVSRTLGDFGFKKCQKISTEEQIVSPAPDVTEIKRNHKTDEFLLLCSDGVFKSMSSSDAVQFVQRQLQITEDLTRICRNLIEMAYYSPNCVPDDTTVVLVVFPAAPSVTQTAIKEEESIETECLKAIATEIESIVSSAEAKWVLKNEFNIIQRIVDRLPRKYCPQLRTEFIIKTLSDAREDRFGVDELQGQKINNSENENESDDPNIYIPGKITTKRDTKDGESIPAVSNGTVGENCVERESTRIEATGVMVLSDSELNEGGQKVDIKDIQNTAREVEVKLIL